MNDYINRADAIRAFENRSGFSEADLILTSDDIEETINAIPAAVVVDVTLCNDCKHYRSNPSGTIGRCDISNLFLRPDYYCAWAERKEDTNG